MTPRQRAERFVRIVAECEPTEGNPLDAALVEAAHAIVALLDAVATPDTRPRNSQNQESNVSNHSALVPETKSFQGSFLLFRRKGHALVRGGAAKERSRPPRFRHQTFAAAETEAQRMLGLFPDSTFVIIQEVARVKLKPVL